MRLKLNLRGMGFLTHTHMYGILFSDVLVMGGLCLNLIAASVSMAEVERVIDAQQALANKRYKIPRLPGITFRLFLSRKQTLLLQLATVR